MPQIESFVVMSVNCDYRDLKQKKKISFIGYINPLVLMFHKSKTQLFREREKKAELLMCCMSKIEL